MDHYSTPHIVIFFIYYLLRAALAHEPLQKRTIVLEEIIISEDVTALAEPDGTFITELGVTIGTETIDSTFPLPSDVSTGPGGAARVATAPKDPGSAAPDITAVHSAASAAHSPSRSSSASVPSLPTSGLKRGLAYHNISLLSDFLGSGSQSSWCYNWNSRPDGAVPTGIEYVPMLWGLSSSLTSVWYAAVEETLQSGTGHILSFNEPDLGPPNPQSNIDYQDAADGYYRYMQRYAGKARLGSPAVTNGDPAMGMGLGWLSKFLETCDNLGCTIDFVAIHWYGGDPTSNVESFKEHVTQAYDAGGRRPIWITEFGMSGSSADQQAFLEDVIPWLDSQVFVERYAYFMVSDGSLISGDSISALGYIFGFLPP